MTEDEAREIVATLVDPAGVARLERLAQLVASENERQNLIAPSTLSRLWSRHILDSVQLLRWAHLTSGVWLDIGTGGGFPGLAVAAAVPMDMVLVEPRRQRARFLAAASTELGLIHVEVRQDKVEHIHLLADVISARAVAPIKKLLRAAIHCATSRTRWLMPRGSGYDQDVHVARAEWEGLFHVEQSLSDPASGIIVATEVGCR